MPELPEVETIRIQLWNKVKGKKISAVDILHPKSVGRDSQFANKLRGLKISNIDRVGKLMIFKFARQKDLFMLAHLKMTGQFFFLSSRAMANEGTDKKGKLSGGGGHTASHRDLTKFPGRHTRVAIHFANGDTLYFNDMRLFGYLRLTDKAGMEEIVAKFGPEPHTEKFDFKEFRNGLLHRNTSIKAVLLDQSFVAGLGNIYVDETLFLAKVHPSRKANSISDKEAHAIARASARVLIEAIQSGGTTFQSFADTEGKAGGYIKKLRVFAREGKPCPKCSTIILKTRVAGRGTHFCPECQVLG